MRCSRLWRTASGTGLLLQRLQRLLEQEELEQEELGLEELGLQAAEPLQAQLLLLRRGAWRPGGR